MINVYQRQSNELLGTYENESQAMDDLQEFFDEAIAAEQDQTFVEAWKECFRVEEID